MQYSLRCVWGHLLLLGSVVVADQLLKEFVLRMSDLVTGSFGSFLTIEVTQNPGVTWSMLTTLGVAQPALLILLIAGILTVFAIIAWQEFMRRGSAIPETLICAGGMANLIDRLWRGGVVDFLSFHIKSWYWPTFNLADVSIFCGVALLVVRMVRGLSDSY